MRDSCQLTLKQRTENSIGPRMITVSTIPEFQTLQRDLTVWKFAGWLMVRRSKAHIIIEIKGALQSSLFRTVATPLPPSQIPIRICMRTRNHTLRALTPDSQ